MRASRLLSLLLLLQTRGRMTAPELAEELEVSVRTVYRDVEALSSAGVPVYPQPGRGGGWSLVGGARTDLSGLTGPESQALFTLVGPGASTSPEAQQAVRKLLRALPSPFRADAAAAAEAVRLDAGSWGEQRRSRPEVVDVVQQAVIDRRQVRVDYTNRTGQVSTVLLDPLGLVAKDDLWYLLATREDGPDIRTYRMDRVASVEVTAQPAHRPEGFDLAREWQRVVSYVEERRARVRATVVVRRRHLWVLRDHFGTYLDVLGDAPAAGDEERIEVTLAAHTARSLAEQLAGWGSMIEVTGPEDVRRELARIGTELTAAYG